MPYTPTKSMKHKSTSIRNVISDIQEGKIFLPPIQRNFVWDYERIVNLFDSIYKNYPVGNCIFWKLYPDTSRNYPLYLFVKEYTENKKKGNRSEVAPRNLLQTDVHAVVDGQQRLSSIYIGLSGVYKYKKSGAGLQNIDANFISSKLYVNLLSVETRQDGERLFEFLSEEDASFMNDRNLWFEVGRILSWNSINSATTTCRDILRPMVEQSGKRTLINRFNIRYNQILDTLERVHQMLNEDRLCFFEIENQNLDEVVEIFTRVNSGGMTLKKSDLLFSILIAQWAEGKEEISVIVDTLNDNGVEVSQDFVMRACLILSDLPVKYNLESFTIKNVNQIKRNWDSIRSSLISLCELLPEIGYKNLPNLSANALLPIAYYICKGGNTKTQKAKRNLQLYYTVSQVNGLFGGQSDQVLEKIRSEIRDQLLHDNVLNFQRLVQLKLPANKTFRLDIEDLSDLVDNVSYGSPHAYFLLSLIYPSVDFKIRRYDVDHIHPRSKFSYTNLNQHGIDDDTIENWQEEKRDLLPNLQLLASQDNNNKRARPLIEYLKDKRPLERKAFMKDNLIPESKELLRLENFDQFYEQRKKRLISKLRSVFGV